MNLLLQKLTIVIFTYNRPKYLIQAINYWPRYNVKLLILDGSNIRLEKSYLNSKNIKYIFNQSGFYERLYSSINYIDTEFMILGCDDEFYLPSALESCVKFLSKEKNFTSCGGRALGFKSIKNKILGTVQYSKFKDFCLDNDHSLERLKKHFYNYVPAHMYSVIRSSKWKMICKHVFKKEFSFFAAMEMQIEFLVMVSGKSKIIPELMWIRNKEVAKIRGTSPSMTESMTMYKWWYDDYYQKEKEEFLSIMNKASNELISENNIIYRKNTVAEIFQIYIDSSIKHKFNKSLYKKFITFLPYQLKKFVKSLLPVTIININKNYKTFKEEVRLIESQGVYVNHKDLNVIISYLEKSKIKN